MRTITLQEKIEKQQQLIAKKKATIEKKTNWISKKIEAQDIYEAKWLTEDVMRLRKECEHAMGVIESLQHEIEKNNRQEKEIENLPAMVKKLINELADKWIAEDIARQVELVEEREKIGKREFYKAHQQHLMDLKLVDESIEQIVYRGKEDAKYFAIDLICRIKKAAGEIESWRYLTVSGYALNGIIKGEKATVRVETITAGGYNIQRLHLRVLVHKVNQ